MKERDVGTELVDRVAEDREESVDREEREDGTVEEIGETDGNEEED